ncbi:MAG: hypothetical protein ACRDS0_08815 [Pseudonocardiaceae bacterium]
MGVIVAIFGIVVAHHDAKEIYAEPIALIGCAPATQSEATRATVVHLADNPPSIVGPVHYTAKVAERVQFEAGGELLRKIPPGKQLFLVSQADPSSSDLDGNRGNGKYYRRDALTVTGTCWLFPQSSISYHGASGLTFRMSLILVDDDRVADFKSKTRDGCDDATLNSLGVIRLAFFEVPTSDLNER